MKKSILILISGLISSVLSAGEAETFFYEQGFQKGKNIYYEKGVNDGIALAKEVLQKYINDIQAYDVGKYLVKNKHLTYPQVWQKKEGDNILLVVTKARLQEEINIEALFEQFGGEIPKAPMNSLTENIELKNDSVYLASRDYAKYLPDNSSRDNEIITLEVEKSYENRTILDKSNFVYQDDNDKYKIMFFSRQEKHDFCLEFSQVCESLK